MRQQVEVEKKEEVAMEMSDLVVYCQPRSKEKDRFGKDTRAHTHTCGLIISAGVLDYSEKQK